LKNYKLFLPCLLLAFSAQNLRANTKVAKLPVDTVTKKSQPNKAELDILIKQLDTIYRDDQHSRQDLSDLQSKKGNQSAGEPAVLAIMLKKDSVNQVKVKAILNKYGWLGVDAVGKTGNEALFYVIQHASIETQLQYLPLLRQAVIDKKASAADAAFLIDRVEMRTGEAQTYGTQANALDNISFMFPIKDVAKVDKRRAAVGLGPVEEFYKGEQVKYNLTPMSKADEAEKVYLLKRLNDMFEEDQHKLKAYITAITRYGKESAEVVSQRAILMQSRNINQQKAITILDTYGWPGYHIIGTTGCTTLFLTMSHADAAILEKYLPLLKKTVNTGEASAGYMANFEDKIEVAAGRQQIYGTQLVPGNKGVLPIKDESTVDERRAKLGLIPLKDYLKQTYGFDYQPIK
jgi:hypothetical protein